LAAEKRFKAIGITDQGRHVLVVFTLWRRDGETLIRLVQFEFQPKSERVNMRLPKDLLDAVKAAAAKAGMPYQRFIRQALEAAIENRKPRRL